MMLVALRKINAGEELLWDYQAISDDPNDPLCQITCGCGGCKAGTKRSSSIQNIC